MNATLTATNPHFSQVFVTKPTKSIACLHTASALVKLTILLALIAVTGCSVTSVRGPGPGGQDGPPSQPVNANQIPDAVPRHEPLSRYGNMPFYDVRGKRYFTLNSSTGYKARGVASWYGKKFHGRTTSSGEPYDMYAMTAAHKTLPLPTYARVTNLENGRSIVVKINDRGPFHDERIIDLSYVAAAKLDILTKGTGLVEVTAINTQTGQVAAASATMASPEKPSLYLQVGAFNSRMNAESMRKRLQHLSAPVHVSPATDESPEVFRVRIGPLTTVAEADQLATNINALGLQPYVIVE